MQNILEACLVFDYCLVLKFIFTTLTKVHETLEDPKSRGKCHNLHSNYTL